ncbi:hypothetical protein BJ166DRAFT_460320 [Pestalotiopsis sp. NC0098]|nr:hypothetical protein BJ166DRAFT_460320 [Pestalotiopsis sp. NC0098]
MINNYNDTRGPIDRDSRQIGTRSLPARPGSTNVRPGGRFAPPIQNPEEPEPWDQISDEHRSEIQDCFTLFDMNKDEQLDFSEFRYALQSLGLGQTPVVADLRLSKEGFQAVAAEYLAQRDPREELLRTFAMFDKGGKGIITIDDLRIVVKELGEDVPENEMQSMIEQFDIEDKGGVNREEFLGIFLGG